MLISLLLVSEFHFWCKTGGVVLFSIIATFYLLNLTHWKGLSLKTSPGTRGTTNFSPTTHDPRLCTHDPRPRTISYSREMCINLKNNAYESCKQFRSISSSGIMCRKSLHVRPVISHFVEIGEVLNIETWHKGRLLLLESSL